MFKVKKIFALFIAFVFISQCLIMTSVSAEDNLVMNISMPLLSLTSLETTSNSTELVWTSNDNNLMASSYDIYRNGCLIKTTENFTFHDTSLISETDYSYKVNAVDKDGNVIAESNFLDIKTLSEELTKLTPPH